MSKVTRPNFFILLGLDPDAVWDQSTFEKVLREKRHEWSRQSTGVARKALQAQQNLALIPKIQEVMEDPALRAQEARDALEERKSQQQDELAQFERQLAFFNAREQVEQADIDTFIADYQHLLPAAEIRQRISVKAAQLAPTQQKKAQPLDKAVYKSITERLAFLQKSTLYDLLELPANSATKELFAAAEQLYMQLVRLSPSADTTAKIELAGLARYVFKTEEMRARYDESLRQATFAALLKELDESMSRSTNNTLSQKQVLLFLENALKEGWEKEVAQSQLQEHIKLRKWTIATPAKNNNTDGTAPDQANTHTKETKQEPEQKNAQKTVQEPEQKNAQKIVQEPKSKNTRSTAPNPTTVNTQEAAQEPANTRTEKTLPDKSAKKVAQPVANANTQTIAQPVANANTQTIAQPVAETNTKTIAQPVAEVNTQVPLQLVAEVNTQKTPEPVKKVDVREKAQPAQSRAARIVIAYRIEAPTFFRKQWTLHIVTDVNLILPALVLINKAESLPVKKTDGQLFYRIQPGPTKDNHLVINLPSMPLPPKTFIKLFLEDDTLYSRFMIHHPGEKQMRLS